jgi:hypothetical protein
MQLALIFGDPVKIAGSPVGQQVWPCLLSLAAFSEQPGVSTRLETALGFYFAAFSESPDDSTRLENALGCPAVHCAWNRGISM